MNVRVSGLMLVVVSAALVPGGATSHAQSSAPAAGPVQPPTGPGGKQYVHEAINAASYGRGAEQYWIFEPDQPRPESAALIAILHGWGAVHPNIYGAWIRHLVLRGNIVVYPRYQENLATDPHQFTAHALAALRDAVGRLDGQLHVKARLEHFAVAGHSVGGILSVNIASLARISGLPAPKAVMSIQPGISRPRGAFAGVPLEDLARVPTQTLLLVIVGQDDRVVSDADARRIFQQTTSVPPENKDFIRVLSDDHGYPPIKADHNSPGALARLLADEQDMDPIVGELGGMAPDAPGRLFAERLFEKLAAASLDATDYYGYWKWFDALCDAAFYGRHRDVALGGTEAQRDLGRWSDDTPVRQPIVTDEP